MEGVVCHARRNKILSHARVASAPFVVFRFVSYLAFCRRLRAGALAVRSPCRTELSCQRPLLMDGGI